MKKLFLSLIFLMLVFTMSGCIGENPNFPENEYERFEVVYDTYNGSNSEIYTVYTTILVDKETGVAYIFVRGDSPSGSSGLTVMLDENGDPLIWEEYKSR